MYLSNLDKIQWKRNSYLFVQKYFVNSIFLSIFSARSIASKGKSDVKESTDSSTTLEDDDKGITITLTSRRGCENVFNDNHSQYWVWLLMETFTQSFHSVNGLLIKVSN